MPTYIDPVDLNLININAISEEMLNNPVEMNKFANSVIISIENELVEAIGHNYYSLKDECENHIAINNKRLGDILSTYKNSEGKDLTVLQRNMVGPLLITQALLHGKEVSAYDIGSGKKTVLNDKMKDHIMPKTLSLWERFLSVFGLVKDRVAESERSNYVTQHIDALISDAKTNHKEYHESILEENKNTAVELGKKHVAFHDNIYAQTKKLNEQYFSAMNPLAFEGGVKKLGNLKAEGQFTQRGWNTIAACAMMKKGYSLEQACNPDFTEGRKEVGLELSKIALGLRNKDKEIKEKAEKDLADIFLEGGKKYLDMPVPDVNEIKNFTESERPYYMLKVAQLGVDLLTPFKSLSKYMLEDPANAIIPELASSIATGGIFNPILNSVQMKLEKSPENQSPESKKAVELEFNSSILGTEIARKFAYDTAVNTATNLREYAYANEAKLLDVQALTQLSKGYAMSILNGRNRDPQRVNDIINGKTSFYETIQKSVPFKDIRSGDMEVRDNYCGTFGQINARAALAKTAVNQVCKELGGEYTEKQKLEFARALVTDKNFKINTKLEPEKIEGLITDTQFLNGVKRNIVLKLSEKDKANVAEKEIAASTSIETEKKQDSLAKENKSKGASAL